jgi:zinc and cadmium transporter
LTDYFIAMNFSGIATFLASILGGISALILPHFKPIHFSLLLIFIGSYLLSLTLLHLLPALFSLHPLSPYISAGVLVGFFLQLFLGTLSKGIEHGHIYEKEHKDHAPISAPLLFLSLFIHAFLDGIILNMATLPAHPHHGPHHTHHQLLIGIVLHKTSESFALANILKGMSISIKNIGMYLTAFSTASPLGLWISKCSSKNLLLSQEIIPLFIALAIGSLLHISTTIFFESSPHHQMNFKKCLAILSGIGLVLISEYLL